MTLRRSLRGPAALTLIVTSAPLSEALAEQAAAAVLEEVVVTARKHEESLMQTPLSITAFTAKSIEKLGLKSMTDISAFTPSFQFVTQAGSGSGRNDRSINQLSFRGLRQGNDVGIFTGAMLFIDGTPVLGAEAPPLTAIERVEVLKGPQSAYFGRSTFAGAINYVTRAPRSEFHGQIGAELSSFGSSAASFSVEGPALIDELAFRLTGTRDDKGAQWTNSANQQREFGARRTDSVDLHLYYTPIERLEINANLNYFENHDGAAATVAIKLPEFNCNLGSTRNYYCGKLPKADKLPAYIISANYDIDPATRAVLFDNPKGFLDSFDRHFLTEPGLRREASNGGLTVSYDTAGGYSIRSITAYHENKMMTVTDLANRDGRNVPNPYYGVLPGTPPFIWWLLGIQSKSHDFSQELRIASPQNKRLRWLVGLNQFEGKQYSFANYGLSYLGPRGSSALIEYEAKTPAIFGSLTYDFTDKLTASAELRSQTDKLSQRALSTTGAVPIPGGGPRVAASFRSVSPRVTLDYKLTPRTMLYALWSKGTRPGGFNVQLIGQSQALLDAIAAFNAGIAYDEENLSNFELGVKSTFLDGRARIMADAYFMPYRNAQVTNFILFTTGSSITTFGVTQNAGSANLRGFEFEGDLQVTDNLLLSSTLAINDVELKEWVSQMALNIRGNAKAVGGEFNNVPKFTATLSADYAHKLTSRFDGFFRVDYRHRGRMWADEASAAEIPAGNWVNLRFGVRDEDLTIEGFVLNATQEMTPHAATMSNDILYGLATNNDIRYALPDKRSIGIRARYSF